MSRPASLMPLRSWRARAASSLVLAAAACAHANGASTAPKRDRVDPPTMQRGPAPETRGEMSATYEVMVDATGRADMSTLRLSGALSATNRAALERWIADARFTPARLNGHPVAGLYKGGLKTRVTRVRS